MAKEGWKTKKLVSLCQTFEDGDWIEKKDQSDSGIRLVQTGNVGNGVFRGKDDNRRYISVKTFDRLRCTEIYPGDFLISRLPEPVGRGCIIPETGERMITAVDCTIIRLKDECLPKFLLYYTQSKEYQHSVSDASTGTTRQRISRKNLGDIAIPLPSLAEQQRIVDILDAEFAKIDALKANAEKNLQNAKDLFQAALRKELEPREGWKTHYISEIFDITDFVSNGSFASLRENVKYYNEPNYAILVRLVDNSNNFDKGRFVYIDKHGYEFLSKSKLYGGELIMCNIGATIGKSFLCPCLDAPMSIGPNVLLMKSSNNQFYNYYFQTDFFQKKLRTIITKTTLEKFNKTQFKQLLITIPTANEQRIIVARLDDISKKCQSLRYNYTHTLTLCDDLKQALLRKAFNGEL